MLYHNTMIMYYLLQEHTIEYKGAIMINKINIWSLMNLTHDKG